MVSAAHLLDADEEAQRISALNTQKPNRPSGTLHALSHREHQGRRHDPGGTRARRRRRRIALSRGRLLGCPPPIHRLSSIDDGHAGDARAVGSGNRVGVRVVVQGAGRWDAGADRVVAGAGGAADECRGDRGGGRGRSVDGVGASEGAGRGAVRAGRAAGHGPLLPGQRRVRGVFPDGRGRGHGPVGTRST